MISNDNEPSTDTVITESKTTSSSNEIQPAVSPPALAVVSTSNATAEEQTVHNENNDQSNDTIDKDVQENRSLVVREDQVVEQEPEQGEGEDDEYIRITAAHQMLTEGIVERERKRRRSPWPILFFAAQTYDEQTNYPAALHLYRICVDLLLEELMFTEGTDQSRVYLREKCTAIMDRIDLLKTKLGPIPAATPEVLAMETTNETEASEPTATVTATTTTNPPSEELSSLHLC